MNERPWEPMGLTTAAWLTIPPSRVLTGSLLPTQAHLSFDALAGAPSSLCGDPIPHAVLWDGELRLLDGHHRLIRARVDEAATILVRVAVPFVHFVPLRWAA